MQTKVSLLLTPNILFRKGRGGCDVTAGCCLGESTFVREQLCSLLSLPEPVAPVSLEAPVFCLDEQGSIISPLFESAVPKEPLDLISMSKLWTSGLILVPQELCCLRDLRWVVSTFCSQRKMKITYVLWDNCNGLKM